MTHFVGNPEDLFCCDEAQMHIAVRIFLNNCQSVMKIHLCIRKMSIITEVNNDK